MTASNKIAPAKMARETITNRKAVHHLHFDRRGWINEQLRKIGNISDPNLRNRTMHQFKSIHAPLYD